MISVELWRARIGTASCRGCSSVSLSSFFFHFCTCRTVRSQVKYSSDSVPSTTVRGAGVEVEERSPAAHSDDEYGSLQLSAISLKHFLLSYSYFPLLSFFSGGVSPSSCSLLSRGVFLLIAIISQLLIMSGDIETNPGPKHRADDKPDLADLQYMSYTGEDGKEVPFRLKTRLKPHWRDLAIALKFLQYDIDDMESKDDPVYYVLRKWRQGANQENDPRPVTWRTLITALRHANIQDEATVLETHLVDTSESVPQPVQSSPRERHSAGLQSTDGDSVGHQELVQSSPGERHSTGQSKDGDIIEHSEGYTKRYGSTQLFVKFDVPESLPPLMIEYANMLLLLRTTKLRGDGFLKIKLFLADYCDEMLIRKCSNLNEVIDFLTKELKIHIFNIETLSGSCKLFNSRKVERSVQQYKHHLDEFLSSTKVKEFKHALYTQLDDYSKVESITLKLDEPRSDDTFKALKKLVYHIFGVSSKAMVYRDTHPGCICVTWVVPISLVPTLRAKARQHSHVYLASQGVLELVIGLRIAPNEENTENLGIFLQQTSRDEQQAALFPDPIHLGISEAASRVDHSSESYHASFTMDGSHTQPYPVSQPDSSLPDSSTPRAPDQLKSGKDLSLVLEDWPSVPIHQQQPSVHQRLPSIPVHQQQPSVPVHQPSVPIHQSSVSIPQPSVPIHQPSVPVHQLSVPIHHPSVPVHQPSVLIHRPSVPVHQQQQPSVPVHQQQPSVPVHQQQPSVPVHQQQPSGPVHQQQLTLSTQKQQPLTPLSTMSHQQSQAPPTMATSHVKLIPAKLKLTRTSPSDKYRSDAALPLTRENYKKKFTALLHLEEDVHNKLLKEKCNGQYQLLVKPRDFIPGNLQRRVVEHVRYAYIYGLSGDQIMYVAQASECLYILKGRELVATADILPGGHLNELDRKLLVGLKKSEVLELERYFQIDDEQFITITNEFEVKHSFFDDLRRSLNNLSDSAIARIMPTAEHFSTSLDLDVNRVAYSWHFSMKLDEECQFPALQLVLFSRSLAPVIIPGPFGTGKTRVLAVAAYNFVETAKQNNRVCHVLVCSHHQVSADTFIESYFGAMWKVGLVRLTRKNYYYTGGLAYKHLYVPLDTFRRQVKAGHYIKSKQLVIVTTFLTALNIGNLFGDDFFTHILLDEGAQVREPEAVAPLCMANSNTKIVIAGDSKQVGPTLLVLGDEPQEFGLGSSLLERLLLAYNAGEESRKYIAHLWTNYRCHKDVLELPSQLFYDSSLKPMSDVTTYLTAPYPLIFVCSSVASPHPIVDDISGDEAKTLIDQLHELCSGMGDSQTFLKETCFMALSRRQVSTIRNCLKRGGFSQVKCLPSYEIQGREFKALFISTVECVHDGFKSANPTKSFCNRYVFNTALTRAQSLVVVAGNPFLLLKVEATMSQPMGCWREYLKRCIDHSTLFVPKNVSANSETVVTTLRQLIEQSEKGGFQLPLPASPKDEMEEKIDVATKEILLNLSGSTMEASSDLNASTAAMQPKKDSQFSEKETSSTTSLPWPIPSLQPSLVPMRTVHSTIDLPSSPRSSSTRATTEFPGHRTFAAVASSSLYRRAWQPLPDPKTVDAASKTEGFPSIEQSQQLVSSSKKNQVPRKCFQPERSKTSTANPLKSFRPVTRRHIKHDHRPEDLVLLETELKQENYCEKFHQLLCREEEEHEKLLSDRCDGEYCLTINERGSESPNPYAREPPDSVRYGYITADDLDGDRVAYAQQSSEWKLIINEKIPVTMIRVPPSDDREQERIHVSIANEVVKKLPGFSEHMFEVQSVKVTFELKYTYFHRLHRALDLLSHSTITRLVPKSITSGEEDEESQVSKFGIHPNFKNLLFLDGPQMNALKVIVNAKPGLPVIIVGSFGTGKTRLLARAAYQILNRSRHSKPYRVLVCAHHQESADSFVDSYFGSMVEDDWDVNMVRMIISADSDHYNNCYREFRYMARDINLKTVQLVVTTFGNALHLDGMVDPGFFTHILMDEGAQTREPENIAPLFLCGPDTVIVIAGDHKQVGPSILVLGEKPQKYHLNVSLLERLHALYTCQKDTSHLCATLLTNYRCHRALLALPSYLFYESTLIISSDFKKQPKLHPHSSSFPLHFICSSLDNTVVEVKKSTNHKEAVLLLDEAVKYVKEWPQEWDDKNKHPVCIMSATANQQTMIRSMLRKKNYYDIFKKDTVETVTVFTMQGRQFQCVFLSTAEPTTAEGASKNPTKTPCSQYVFNTALTRAKSLVVCAGNPFLLMKIEKKTKNTDIQPFWAEYIRRCMENETFITPESLQMSHDGCQEKIDELRRLVFKPDTLALHDSLAERKLDTMDSITKAYKKAFMKSLPNLQDCQLKLKYAKGGMQWQMKEEDNDEEEPATTQKRELPEGVFHCTLEVVSYHKALAHPLNPKQPVITLNGLGNRRGAFDGDIVAVKLYDSEAGKSYGKVVHVIEQCHRKRYVCQVDHTNALHFHPIDKITPTFVNLPKISKALYKYQKEDIKAGLNSQNQWIVVFAEDSLVLSDGGSLPRIRKVISADNASSLLFVVKEIGWDPKCRLPLGAVVESLPLGTNSFFSEQILKVVYSMNELKEGSVEEEDEEEKDEELTLQPCIPSPNMVYHAFIIHSNKPHNEAHALSLIRESDGMYTFSIFIPNIGGQLKKDGNNDKRARARGNYTRNGFVNNMLPVSLCQKLGLSSEKVCDVFIVSTTFTVDEYGTVDVDAANSVIKVGKLQTHVQLNYLEAQCILDQDPSNLSKYLSRKIEQYHFSDQPDLPQSLQHLYNVAMHLRVKRLGQAAYAYKFTEEKVGKAHLIVKELTGWANATIAEYIYCHFPDSAVLRRQRSPREEDVKELLESFAGVIGHSVSFSALSGDDSKDLKPLLIPHKTLAQIHKAIEDKDAFHLQCLVAADHLYPQLAAAKAHMKAVKQKAEYICSTSIGQTDASCFHHYGRGFHYYTHVTSPTLRYCDVVVQRILFSILNSKKECSYTPDHLKKLCQHLNVRSREAKLFLREVNQLELAKIFGESCVETQGYIHKNQHKFEVYFPDPKYQYCLKKAEFHISALVCEEEISGFLNWRAFIYSFQGNDFILKNSDLHFSEGAQSEDLIEVTVFCMPECKSVVSTAASSVRDSSWLNMDQDRLCKYQLSSVLTDDVIAVEAATWQSIKTNIDSLSEDRMQQLSDVLPKPQKNKRDVSHRYSPITIDRFKMTTTLKCKVRHKLGSNTIVPVWFGQTLVREPILTPCLQLMEVAPELRICLQHNTHPAECFSDPQIYQASKGKYASLEEYVKLWEKVYLAEVAYDSVHYRGKHLRILKDVPLQWPTFVDNSTDEYYAPDGSVTLEIPFEKRMFFKYSILINVGDLVCVRYDVKKEQCRAVYHFVVTDAYEKKTGKTERKDLPFVLEMRHFGRGSCHVSQKMKDVLQKYKPTCEMQVVNVQESHHRVYKLLTSFKNVANKDLVHLVARGDISAINRLKNPSHESALKVLTSDKMANTLWSTPSTELNEVQRKAIRKALKYRFQLIQGPPGTGKSETGAHIAYIFAQLLEEKQCVVYCAPSNKAVDVVHDKLCKANEKLKLSGGKELKLLRLYGKKHEKIDFPGPYTSDGYLPPAEGESRCVERFQKYALHHLIRKDCPELTEMEEEFKKMYQEDTVPTPLKLREYKNLIKRMEKEVFGKHYNIILATCNECAGRRLSDLKGPDGNKIVIAQVIVDECGMAHEPETIAAVSLSEHVILIGDHKQLQPVVQYSGARENGLSTSLFQRYAENFEERLITLRVQYRMHTKICEFPSEHFYKGMLKPDCSVENRIPLAALQKFWPAGRNCPVGFCDVIGKEKETPGLSDGQEDRKTDLHSKCNLEEAKKAVQIAQILHSKINDKRATIAILTPYRAQRDCLVDELDTAPKLTESLGDGVTKQSSKPFASVLTINESQGDEYDYVILTTVRSQPLNEIRNPDLVQPDKKWLHENLGFVTDPHQVNVAITRAREGLIIVGNRTLLQYDETTWEPLIQFYKDNKCVVDGSKFP